MFNSNLITSRFLYSSLLAISILFLSIFKFFFLDPLFIDKGEVYSDISTLSFIYFGYLIFLYFFCKELAKEYSETFLASFELLFKIILITGFIFFFINIAGFDISVVGLLAGKEARLASNDSIGIGMIGIVEEPSTYGAVLIIFSLLLFISKKNQALALIGLLCSFLTFSTAIWFITPIILLVLVFTESQLLRKYPITILLSSLLFLVIFIGLTSNIQISKISDGYAVSIRLFLFELLSNRDAYMIFWAAGPWGYESVIRDLTDPWYGALRSASINDLGSFVFIYILFGTLGLIAFFSFILKEIKGLKMKIIFLVTTLLKLSIMHPLFLLYMAAFSHFSSLEAKNN
tara:strand:- start:806 stop:1843 length:1038 start_codon:yes stop_codon:yes gene_type:complete